MIPQPRILAASEAAACAAGQLRRVGGLRLTQRALDFCCFAPASRLADIGCGQGATVAFLRAAGFEACGLDFDAAALFAAGPHCQAGDAQKMPYEDSAMDGLFFECSLSQMAKPSQVLAEARRVLKPQGRLIISDLYARQEKPSTAGPLLDRERWYGLMRAAAFTPLLFEDKSADLQALTAQLLWQYGRESLEKLYDCEHEALKSSRCGYFLLIACKEE